MEKIKSLIWLLVFLGVAFSGGLMLVNENLWGILFIVISFWGLMSVKIIGPEKMAVFVILGTPVEVKDSGIRIVPWLISWIIIYPKKMYSFSYPEKNVITRAGRYKKVDYEAQVIEVNSNVYLNFPRDNEEGKTHPLIRILRAGIKTDESSLKTWVEGVVFEALRVALAQMTWKESIQNINKVNIEVEKVFKNPDGALMKAGFRDPGIKIVITEVHPPTEIKKALASVEKQRLEAEAAPFEAEQQAEETGGAIVRIFSKLTGMSRESMEEEIRKNPNDFFEKYKVFLKKSWDMIHRRMAIDGKSYIDIRSQNSLQDLLALWQMMSTGKKGGKEMMNKEKEEKEEKKKWVPSSPQEHKEAMEKIRNRKKE